MIGVITMRLNGNHHHHLRLADAFFSELDIIHILPKALSMAVIQVLNSPELLSLILQHFEEHEQDEFFEDRLTKLRNRSARSNLANFARVNCLWFETATRVLWAYEEWGPMLEDLTKIEASRQQTYASKLTSIRTESLTGQTPNTAALSLPRVRRLHFPEIGRQDGLAVTSVKQYLRPSINSIYFRMWENGFNKELLICIHTQCLRLRSLRLEVRDCGITDITPRDLNDLFRKQPLELVLIKGIMPPQDLLSTLGEKEDLRSLSIISFLSLKQIPECFLDENVVIFMKLYEVDLRLKREAVSSVTMAVRHASRAKLVIRSSGLQDHTPMFSSLKHMKNLVDLAIYFIDTKLCLDRKDLNNIRTLKNLEFLLVSRGRQPDPSHVASSDLFLHAIFGLPRLHTLDWQMCWLNVSIKTLSALSRHTPNLRQIFFYGAFDLQALTDVSGCLFPNLETLVLERAVLDGHKGQIPFKRIATQILRHAPKLKTLHFEEDPQSKVVDSWKKLKEEKEAAWKNVTYRIHRARQNPFRKIPLVIYGKINVDKIKPKAMTHQEMVENAISRPRPGDPRWRREECPEPQTSSS